LFDKNLKNLLAEAPSHGKPMAWGAACAFVNKFTRRSRHPLPHFVPMASAKENHKNRDWTITIFPLVC